MQLVSKNLFVKALFLVLLTAAFTLVVPAQTVADVDAVVQKMIDAKTIPAAGVAVVRDGKVVLAKGYGSAVSKQGRRRMKTLVFRSVR